MASHMAMSYGPQTTQVNEKPPLESFLGLNIVLFLLDLSLTPFNCFMDLKHP
jgi:hypothetical protein